jgi:tetratricopeptide (TPR) repeat protein
MEGKNRLAWEAANNAVQLAPENPRYYHQRAYVQASLSNAGDEESEQLELDDYFKILTMPYDSTYMVHNNLGYSYFLRQEDDRADKHFTQALEGCPYFIKARINRADLRYFTNQFDASLADCDAVIAVNPSFYEAYWLKGSNYFNHQEFGKAFHAYHTAFHLCEFYNEQVVLPFLGLAVKLGKIDMCFEEMQLIIAFYGQHMQVASNQITALEELQRQPELESARSECVTQLSALVIHSHDLKDSYYCEVFNRNIANRDWLVIAEPFAAQHVTSMLTLIKRKLSGHYAIYELVLLKYLELCYATGSFEAAEQARVKLLALPDAAHYTKKDTERTYHMLDFVREIDVSQVSAATREIAREMMQRSIVTTYDVDDYIFEELKQKHAQRPLPSTHDAKYLLLVFTYKTLTMRIHDPEPLGFSSSSTSHLAATFKKVDQLSHKNKLMSAHQLIVEYEFQDTSV